MANRKLADRIADVPAELQKRAMRGFKIFAGLSDENIKKTIEKYLAGVASGITTFEVEDFTESTKLTRSEVGSLVAALSIVAGLTSEGPASLDEFAEHGPQRLFEPADKLTAVKIIQCILDKQGDLENSYERATLAAENLPSLRQFEATVELRPKFEKLEIKDAVPITIVHISTDGDPEIWFQLTKGDLEAVLDKLKTAAQRMEVSENIARSILSRKSV